MNGIESYFHSALCTGGGGDGGSVDFLSRINQTHQSLLLYFSRPASFTVQTDTHAHTYISSSKQSHKFIRRYGNVLRAHSFVYKIFILTVFSLSHLNTLNCHKSNSKQFHKVNFDWLLVGVYLNSEMQKKTQFAHGSIHIHVPITFGKRFVSHLKMPPIESLCVCVLFYCCLVQFDLVWSDWMENYV